MTEPKQTPSTSDEDYSINYELKKEGLERILGPMHDMVSHAIIPFQVGGAVDMYYFPHAIPGTAFVTMELIEPNGSGPQPSRIGTYELIAFTRLEITRDEKYEVIHGKDGGSFNAIERRLCGIFTSIGRYSAIAILNPCETCEVPAEKDEPYACLVLDEWKKPGLEFKIGSRKHGLLLCIEIFRSEMEFAMQNGSQALFKRLKAKGYYPYSDLDRQPVA